MVYLALKLFHVIAVVLFLGNIVTGIFWKAHADRTRDPRLIAHTLDGIIRSDRWFTLPGVAAIHHRRLRRGRSCGIPLLHTGWVLWSIVLFSLSGLAFSFRVAPLQRALAALARAQDGNATFDWVRYHALSTAVGGVGTVRAAHARAGRGVDGAQAGAAGRSDGRRQSEPPAEAPPGGELFAAEPPPRITCASMAKYSGSPSWSTARAVPRLRSSTRCQNSRSSMPGKGARSFWL